MLISNLVKIRGVDLLESHEMGADDFHNWVANGVLTKDEQVRHLRSVLADAEAKAILCEGRPGGLQEAIDHVQDKRRADKRRAEHAEHLRGATLLDLARALSNRVGATTITEISDLEKRPEELKETVTRLREGADKLAPPSSRNDGVARAHRSRRNAWRGYAPTMACGPGDRGPSTREAVGVISSESHIPDVVAWTPADGRIHAIGEAKPRYDLWSVRFRLQLLDWLSAGRHTGVSRDIGRVRQRSSRPWCRWSSVTVRTIVYKFSKVRSGGSDVQARRTIGCVK